MFMLSGNVGKRSEQRDAQAEVYEHSGPAPVDENGYLMLDGQPKRLEEDGHEYLVPNVKLETSSLVEGARYSEVQ